MENQQSDYGNPNERVVGQFTLSIATSLAIESAVGIHPDLPRPNTLPILHFQELWINMRTLYRNYMGALSKGLAETIGMLEIVQGLLEEMETIPDVLREFTGNKPLKVVYYFSNYKDMDKKYPKAVLRVDNTDKQLMYTKMHNAVMEFMVKHHGDKFQGFDLKLSGNPTAKTAIITHYAYDLLSYKEFGRLTLLESHTGRFKGQSQWYTKYHGGKTLSMIPFREDFIQVFGDNEHFRPMDVSLRKALVEIATKRKWSSVTTKAYIETGIDELQNPAHKLLMKTILV